MRIFKPSRRPGGRRLKGCICITIAGRTRRWDLKRQEWCMTTKRKINRSFLSPQGCAPVRYAHLHYALRGKKTKQQQPITKVPNLFQDLTENFAGSRARQFDSIRLNSTQFDLIRVDPTKSKLIQPKI